MQQETKKRGLGRGLGALIVDTSSTPAAVPPEAPTSTLDTALDAPDVDTLPGTTVAQIPVDALRPNPHQPRADFNPDALAELTASIQVHGILQPLVVANSGSQGIYWIVAGERRWRAAQLAGLATVPAIVREASPLQLREWALVENLQRDDLNPLEEATAFQALIDEHGLTQVDIAARVGKSRSAVANTVRLLQLPPAAQQALVNGRISAGHARALLALGDPARMSAALAEIVARDLNVRQAEALVKRLGETPPAPLATAAAEESSLTAHFRHLEGRFRAALGTKVNLNRNQDGSGRLVVHFYSDDDLDTIYRLIAGEGPSDGAGTNPPD